MYEAMACPASYQAQYIHGIQSPPNEFSVLGQECHHAMSVYTAHLRASDLSEDWDYFMTLLPYFTIEAQEILSGFIGSMKFNPQTILTTEMRFYDEDAAGTPDLVTMESPENATILDYKNYFEMIDPDTFQSKLYPLLLFRHNPNLKTVRFVLVFLRYGRTREVIWTREQVPMLERTLRDARVRQKELHNIEGLAQAIPGKTCEYCPLLRTARCQVNDWNPYATMTDEERLRYVIYTRAALASSTAILRQATRFRAITVADGNGKQYEARFVAGEKRTLPLMPTLKVIEQHADESGEDLTDKLMVSKTSLGSLRSAKKRVLLDQALRDIELVKPVTAFKISRINPEHPDEE
jgi:hypothetical protein